MADMFKIDVQQRRNLVMCRMFVGMSLYQCYSDNYLNFFELNINETEDSKLCRISLEIRPMCVPF